jgi:hypothetical protein
MLKPVKATSELHEYSLLRSLFDTLRGSFGDEATDVLVGPTKWL